MNTEAYKKIIQRLMEKSNPTKTLREMKRISKTQAIFAVTGLKKKFTQEISLTFSRRHG